MESQLGFNDVIVFIKRRKKVIILSFGIIFPLVAIIALLLPPIYKAETTILRESQQVSEDYIRSTITGYAEERLNAATQQVMSRSNLQKIIKAYNLYPELRAKKTFGEIISKMRSAIKLETIYAKVANERTGRASVINTAFKLSYEGKEPLKVQKVANTLASLYIELEMQTRGKRASATSTFFHNELENLKDQIRVYEEKISQFKEAHTGELPENLNSNIRGLERLERDLDQTEDRLQTLEEKRLFLAGQIATVDPLVPIKTDRGKMAVNPAERLRQLRLQLMSLQSSLSEKHPDIKRLQGEINELESQLGKSDAATLKVKRLNELEKELASLKGRFSAKHPDVIRLEKEIEKASTEVNELMTEKVKTNISEDKPDNPTYINLQTQIFVTELEIEKLKKDRDEIKGAIEKYRKRIENTPVVEKEYHELTRDYSGSQKKYNDLSTKLMEAKVSQGVEESQFGERFIIVDPAALPETPYKPNRLAIILLGFIFAIGMGVGLAVIQESMDNTIKSADELNRVTGGNVFSVISFVETAGEVRRRKVKRLAWVFGVVGLVAVVVFVVNEMVMPIEILWAELMKRFGDISI